jgi:hypothetical protein
MSATHLTFKQSNLTSIFDENTDEFATFSEILSRTASEHPEILGVLLTGSLVQRRLLPDPFPNVQGIAKTSRQLAYQEIVSRTRRKLWPHSNADLDIWLLIEDETIGTELANVLSSRALDLIAWYSKQKSIDTNKWIQKKHRAFDEFYKKERLYPRTWLANNPLPHHGSCYKEMVIYRTSRDLQDFTNRIRFNMNKTYPSAFLELRAFPESVFNLRPEKIEVCEGSLDRTPFAYYMKDWLDLEQNCMIVYTRPDAKDLIYPFSSEGRVPGQAIADEIEWDHRNINLRLFRDRKAICY